MGLILVSSIVFVLWQTVVPERSSDDVVQQPHLLIQAASIAGVQVCWQLQH
jgi:hypothetical protein